MQTPNTSAHAPITHLDRAVALPTWAIYFLTPAILFLGAVIASAFEPGHASQAKVAVHASTLAADELDEIRQGSEQIKARKVANDAGQGSD